MGPMKQITLISFENSMPKCNILQYFKTLGIFHHNFFFFGKVINKKIKSPLLEIIELVLKLPRYYIRIGSEGSLSKPRIIQHDGIKAILGHFRWGSTIQGPMK